MANAHQEFVGKVQMENIPRTEPLSLKVEILESSSIEVVLMHAMEQVIQHMDSSDGKTVSACVTKWLSEKYR